VLLENEGLDRINQKILAGEFFHYSGIPFRHQLQKAYTSSNSLYIYPVINGVVLMKKELAIVPKNRVENPFLKVTDSAIEDFNTKYNFDSLDNELKEEVESTDDNHLIKSAKERIERSGKVLVTANSSSSGALLNLSYGLNYEFHYHIDFDFDRIHQVQMDLPDSIVLVLGDREYISFDSDVVDTMCDFAPANTLTKVGQTNYYNELKRVLREDGISVTAYSDLKSLALKKLLNKDIRSLKALKVISPWKKVKLPKLYFIGITTNQPMPEEQLTVKKAKFSNQLN